MTIKLRVNGSTYEGFRRGSVALSMETVENTFEVEYEASANEAGQREIFKGDSVEVVIDAGAGAGEEILVSGFVDETDEEDDTERVTTRVLGRSWTGDLVDCSAVSPPLRWSGATVEKIARDLCLPFEVGVFVESDPGAPFESFAVQQGESVIDAIGRAAIRRGLLTYCVGGDLVLSRAGQTRTATVLERGVNVRRWGRSDSDRARFSEYHFRGQARATDDTWGAASSQLSTFITDEAIKRYRPLRVLADASDEIDLKTRATLERNRRAGQGERVVATVVGWATAEGSAWRPNLLVRARNLALGFDATMIVVSARFNFTADDPAQTELELTRPEAFDIGKYPALGRGESWA